MKYGLKEHENREKEKALFMAAINKAKEADKQQGVKTINEFLSFKKRVSGCCLRPLFEICNYFYY